MSDIWQDRCGVTAIEWALIAAVCAICAAPVFPRLAANLSATFDTSTNHGLYQPATCGPNPSWSDPGRHAALVC